MTASVLVKQLHAQRMARWVERQVGTRPPLAWHLDIHERGKCGPECGYREHPEAVPDCEDDTP